MNSLLRCSTKIKSFKPNIIKNICSNNSRLINNNIKFNNSNSNNNNIVLNCNNSFNNFKRNFSSSSNNNKIINNNNNYKNNNSNSNNSNNYKFSFNNFNNIFQIKKIGNLIIIVGFSLIVFKIYQDKIGIIFCENENQVNQILDNNNNNNNNKEIIINDQDNENLILEEINNEFKKISTFKLFIETIGNDIWLFCLGIVTAFASSWVGLQVPKVFGKLVDCTKNGESLRDPATQAITILLVQALLNFLYSTLISIACERYSSKLRNRLFSSILEQDIGFFDSNSTGDLINRISSDVQLVRSALKHSVSLGVKSIGQIIGGVISLVLISPKLSLSMMTILPTMVSVGTIYAGWLKSLSLRSQAAQAQSTIVAEEAIANIRTVTAFSNQELESKRFIEKNKQSLDLSVISGTQIGIFQGITSLALNAVSLLVYWYGGTLVTRGEITSGQLTSFIIHTMNMQHSFSQISILFTQTMSAMGGMHRITEMINRLPSINSNVGYKLKSLKGHIEFKNVDFNYPSRPHIKVLNDLNLVLNPGQVIALAGASGGGKSTIAGLIERFYDCTNGDILIDGVSIKKLNAKWLRSKIGIVTQEPCLFATSIIENLRYGNPTATMEEIIEAAKLANAHQFISLFPDGYDTIVGERGVQLSGGQKQRIAIARAILKNPQIIILDESTSALDAEAEHIVKSALDNLMKGRTTLIIAHRLSTVQSADAIGVLSHGKVVEFGPHKQLMKNHNGLYYNLVQRQLSQNAN